MSELVSIIVPVYNAEKYIKACIDSIRAQTYREIEIIIVNDGSTDSSGRICEEEQNKDNRIKYYEQDNGGLSVARNSGMRVATGNYYAFVDSDDIIASVFIEKLLHALKKYECDIACCESVKFTESDENKARMYWEKSELEKDKVRVLDQESVIVENLYEKVRVTEIPYKIYKREVFEDVEFPEGIIYEDLATTYRLFQRAKQVAIISKKYYGYRLREDSLFKSKYSKKNLSSVYVAEKLFSDIGSVEKYKKAASNACFRVNRVTFNKVPFFKTDDRKKIWQQIVKYRKTVLFDSYSKKYERILAGCSYGGELFFKVVVWLFDYMKYTYYYLQK